MGKACLSVTKANASVCNGRYAIDRIITLRAIFSFMPYNLYCHVKIFLCVRLRGKTLELSCKVVI